MRKKIMLSEGDKFGRLTVEKQSGHDNWGHQMYSCVCDCGNSCNIVKQSLTKGTTISCGCFKKEVESLRFKTHGWSYSSDPIKKKFWGAYKGIKKRCYQVNSKSYSYYGGRGIFTSWRTFEEFRNDMLAAYMVHIKKYGIKNTTLDRINVDGQYDKKNTRWATWEIQHGNKRSIHFIEHNGVEISIAELSRVHTDVKYPTLLYRINHGWTVKEAIIL